MSFKVHNIEHKKIDAIGRIPDFTPNGKMRTNNHDLRISLLESKLYPNQNYSSDNSYDLEMRIQNLETICYIEFGGDISLPDCVNEVPKLESLVNKLQEKVNELDIKDTEIEKQVDLLNKDVKKLDYWLLESKQQILTLIEKLSVLFNKLDKVDKVDKVA